MSTSGFITGTELLLTILSPTGAQVKLGGRRDMFEEEDRSKPLTSEPSDNGGLVDDRVIPGGWRGSITVDKNNPAFGQLYGFIEANKYAGGTEQKFTMTLTIASPFPGGSTERVQHTLVTFHGYKVGPYQKNQITKETIQWLSQQRIPL